MYRILDTRQVSKRSPANRVHAGRSGKSRNPFVIGRDGTGEEVIAQYHASISGSQRCLSCCGPARCQAEVLITRANGKQ
jgi:hypothetical protein